MLTSLQNLLLVAGLAQIALVAGSLAIPRLLNWHHELAKVQVHIRQMFWTYAAYILVINLCFGLVSVCCYPDLLNGSKLAMLVTGFIAVYWVSRVLIQFLYFDRAAFPKGKVYLLGETALTILFIFLSGVYAIAAYYNYSLLSSVSL